jgi:hypothetical protein
MPVFVVFAGEADDVIGQRTPINDPETCQGSGVLIRANVPTFYRPSPVEQPGAEAPGPDPRFISALHRGADGFVTFHSKADGSFRTITAFTAGSLNETFDQIRPELEMDSYFSINGFFRAHRSGKTLRYLNAVFIDLDVYNAGLTVGQAIGRVVDLQDAGAIPPASMLARSGRGLWLFWILEDPNHAGLPQPAFPEKVEHYTRVGRELRDRLAALGPDAYDAVRVARVPGSMNPKSSTRVSYWTQAGSDGLFPTYTLDSLGSLIGVPERAARATRDRRTEDSSSEAKRAGWRALQRKRFTQLRALEEMRGGFGEGCRNRAALLCAMFARTNGLDPMAEVEELAQRCRTPLEPSARRGAVRGSEALALVRDQTIADWLQITPAESERLDGWPPAAWYPRDPVADRSDRREARRRLIMELVARFDGRIPSTRTMVVMLADQGHTATAPTIGSDYRALGLGGVEALPLIAA